MYENLVKRLRELPHLLFVQLHGHEDVVYKAADAIEELSKAKEEPAEQVVYWQTQLTQAVLQCVEKRLRIWKTPSGFP